MARGRSIISEFADLKREYRSDYDAASPSRFRKRLTGLYGTGDAHYATERKYFEVVEYCRAAERNDPLIRPALGMVVNQIVQGGFGYEPKTGDDTLDDEIREWHQEWAGDASAVDLAGQHSFASTEKMVLRSVIRDGDIIVLPTEEGMLQFCECERMKSPARTQRNMVHGVEMNEYRRPVRYWLTKGRVDPLDRIERISDLQSYPAYDEEGYPQVFHVYEPDRVTQARGVSAFIAAQIKLGVADDIDFALLVKEQIAACLAATIESKDGSYSDDTRMGQRSTLQGAGGEEQIFEELKPGIVKRMPPGKTLKYHSPQVPSAETMQHLARTIQVIGLQVGLPLVMMLLDASETNFSGFRGAVDTARSMWREWQRGLARRYHSPLATWRLRWAMGRGDAWGRGLKRQADKLGLAFFRHEWHYPSWKHIQPREDATARALRLSTAQISPRRSCAEDSLEWPKVAMEIVQDNELLIGHAIEAATRLNQKAGAPVVHWRDLTNRDLYAGGSVTDSVDVANGAKAANGKDSTQG